MRQAKKITVVLFAVLGILSFIGCPNSAGGGGSTAGDGSGNVLRGIWRGSETTYSETNGGNTHTRKEVQQYVITDTVITYQRKSGYDCHTGDSTHSGNYYANASYRDDWRADFAINKTAKTFTLSNIEVSNNASWVSVANSSRSDQDKARLNSYAGTFSYKLNGTTVNFLLEKQTLTREGANTGSFYGKWKSIQQNNGVETDIWYEIVSSGTLLMSMDGINYVDIGASFIVDSNAKTFTATGPFGNNGTMQTVKFSYNIIPGSPEKMEQYMMEDFTKVAGSDNQLFGTWIGTETSYPYTDESSITHTRTEVKQYVVTDTEITFQRKEIYTCNTNEPPHAHYGDVNYRNEWKASFAINETAKTLALSNVQIWDNKWGYESWKTVSLANFVDHNSSHTVNCYTQDCVYNNYGNKLASHNDSHNWDCQTELCKTTHLYRQAQSYMPYNNSTVKYGLSGNVVSFAANKQVIDRVGANTGAIYGQWKGYSGDGSTEMLYDLRNNGTLWGFMGSWQQVGTYTVDFAAKTFTATGPFGNNGTMQTVKFSYNIIPGNPEKMEQYMMEDFTKAL